MVKKSNWTIEDDERLIYFFEKGYYAREIARKLNRTKGAVDKRIQKFKKDGKIRELREEVRERRRVENREIKKAINSENNRYLSNRETIRACMSVYKNNDKGDLVLDRKKGKEQGFAFPLDMPYSNVNEEIRKFEKFEEKNGKLDIIEYVKRETERLKDFQEEVQKGIDRISV